MPGNDAIDSLFPSFPVQVRQPGEGVVAVGLRNRCLSLFYLMVLTVAAPGEAVAVVRALTIEGDTIEGRFTGVNGEGAVLIAQDGGVKVLPADSLMQLTWPEAEPAPELAPEAETAPEPAPELAPGPGQAASRSAQAASRPGQAASRSAQAASRPGQAASRPAQAVSRSAQAASRSAQAVSGPGQAASRPALALPQVIYFNDGSRLAGRITGGDARSVELTTTSRGEMSVPLSDLAGVRFAHGESAEAQEAFKKALQQRDASEDMLIVVRDERVTSLRGVTELLDGAGGRFKWRGRSVAIEPERTYGLVMARGVQNKLAAPVLCRLHDGEVIAGRLVASDAEQIEVRPVRQDGGTEQAGVKLAVGQVAEVRFNSDRVKFLDELEPADYAFEPFATTRWGWRANRSAANRPMRIGGRAFERGIGVHSKATLSYELTDAYTRLAGVIGIDDAVGPLGSVVFKVVADDKEVFDSGPVRGKDEARPILVPIAGAKQLKLVVDFGEDLDIGDQADWGNVRLLK